MYRQLRACLKCICKPLKPQYIYKGHLQDICISFIFFAVNLNLLTVILYRVYLSPIYHVSGAQQLAIATSRDTLAELECLKLPDVRI